MYYNKSVKSEKYKDIDFDIIGFEPKTDKIIIHTAKGKIFPYTIFYKNDRAYFTYGGKRYCLDDFHF